MQISRRILLACVAATALFPLVALSGDNAAQVKAREALEQQMNQAPPAEPAIVPPPPMPAAPPPAPPVPAPVKQRRAPKPAAVKAPPHVEWPELPSTAAAENSHELEDVLHQKMSETHAQTPPAPAVTAQQEPAPAQPAPAPAEPPAVVAPAPAPASVTPPAEPAQPPSPPVKSTRAHRAPKTPAAQTTDDNAKWGAVEVTPGMSQEQMNQAQQALQGKMSQMGPEPTEVQPKEATKEVKPESTAARAPATAHASTAPAKRAPVARTKLPPLPAPPSPVSASKEQQLETLLQQYTSDQISPEQYHQQRAKILAEP